MQTNIKNSDLETWADYLLDYSLDGITKDDIVMIKGEHITWPLMSVLQDKIFAAVGIADVNIVAPDNDRGKVWGASMARHGSLDQISHTPDWHDSRYHTMTKYIDIIVKASTNDPRKLENVEEEIYQQMSQSKVIRIITSHPDNGKDLELQMNIAEKNIVKCTGLRNFPDGEVFTSPDANTVEGEIYVDLPVAYSGTTIQGIYLQFKDGIIRDYSAKQGFDALKKIIETDEGSHRLGEIALGMNQGIQKVLKHPLFVEKVGGTLHIAIGASYPECYVSDPASESGKSECDSLNGKGILNRSAQHVDIVTDFRPGGAGKAVFLDDVQLAVQDNIWVVP